MSKDILLDTGPIIAHLRGKIDITEQAPDGALLFTTLFTVGELRKGIYKAANPDLERTKIEIFLKNIAVIVPDEITADIYAHVAADLEKRGQKIPENDVWIAAMALEYDMILAHCDAHFDRVPGLDHLRWTW